MFFVLSLYLFYSIEGDHFAVSSYQSCLQRLGFETFHSVVANNTLVFSLDSLEPVSSKFVYQFNIDQYKTNFDDWMTSFESSIKKRTSNLREKVFIGSMKGDKVKVSIPSKDHDVLYEVLINAVEEQVLPEINDELAKSINENAKNLNDLKKIIKDQIQLSLDKDHESLIQKEIINFFVNKAKIEVPKSMIDRYLDHVKEDLKQKKQEISEDELKENYNVVAESNIKWYLLKGLLVDNEKINISNNELESKIKMFIGENKNSKKQIEDFYSQDENKQRLFDDMLNEKLFDKLKQDAKIKVVEKSTKELRKKQ